MLHHCGGERDTYTSRHESSRSKILFELVYSKLEKTYAHSPIPIISYVCTAHSHIEWHAEASLRLHHKLDAAHPCADVNAIESMNP